MDINYNHIDIITPLGTERYSIARSASTITLGSNKGSADFNISKELDNYLVATAALQVPFDCIAEVCFGEKNEIKLIDPNTKDQYITCLIEVK